ncbi:MAG: hypothetical protein PHP53_24520, partial [Prolixibacteraceae bacterium]|nr:hypothetical protein [Prolixibacteraceae bacterium]
QVGPWIEDVELFVVFHVKHDAVSYFIDIALNNNKIRETWQAKTGQLTCKFRQLSEYTFYEAINYRDGNNVRNAYRLYIFSVALWLTGGHLGVVGSIAELFFYALGLITTLLIFAEVHHEGNAFSSCRLSRDES